MPADVGCTGIEESGVKICPVAGMETGNCSRAADDSVAVRTGIYNSKTKIVGSVL